MNSLHKLTSVSAPLRALVANVQCNHNKHDIFIKIHLGIIPDTVDHSFHVSNGIITTRQVPARPRVFEKMIHQNTKIFGQVVEEWGEIRLVGGGGVTIDKSVEGEELIFDFSDVVSDRVNDILYSFEIPACFRLYLI